MSRQVEYKAILYCHCIFINKISAKFPGSALPRYFKEFIYTDKMAVSFYVGFN